MGEESSYKSKEFHPFEAVRRGLVKLHGEDERDHLHIVQKQCGAMQQPGHSAIDPVFYW